MCFGRILMTVLVCTPVAAQTPSPDWSRCVHEGKEFTLDARISACTAVLQSARETPSNLAIAYQARLKAYRDKAEHDRHHKR
jgi:glutaminase